MNQEGLAEFEMGQKQERELIVAVGSITLAETCGRKEYVLASLDVLNRRFRWPALTSQLEPVIKTVVMHRLWDADNKKDGRRVFQSYASIHRELIETVAHLQANGLLSTDMQVTEAGTQLLQSVTPRAETH